VKKTKLFFFKSERFVNIVKRFNFNNLKRFF
jgi:hypothetical protein